MFTTVLFFIFAICARLSLATPPACLLAAINTESNPADLSTICGKDAYHVELQIMSLCGSNANAAMLAFSSTCAAAGTTVPTLSASTSASATSPGSGSITSAPSTAGNATVLYTSTYFNTSCSCTMTSAISTTIAVTSTGLARSSVSGLTGSAAIPTSPTGTATGSTATHTGSASTLCMGSCAALLIGVAGFFMTM